MAVAAPFAWPTPAAAYVHTPFCRHRCGYCNFAVIAGRDDLAEAFLTSLENELRHQLGAPRPVETLFLGGGTPTHLPAEWIERLLRLLQDWLPLTAGGEFSVEANPCDIDAEKLSLLERFGVNRLSLGVQSFRREKLQTLERDHDGAAAMAAVEQAASVIPNLSIDLIFAAPDETTTDWEADLATAYRLPIQHLSTYALTFEKGTAFWNRRRRGQLNAPAEDTELAMYDAARRHAAAADWDHYEISNFAAPGSRCRHNVHYWMGRGWYGFGPGAAAFVQGCRSVNHRSPRRYIDLCLSDRDPRHELETITPAAWACERLAFGIRMLDGVDVATLVSDSGFDVTTWKADAIERFCDRGWLRRRDTHLQLTDDGLLWSDTIAADFLPEPELESSEPQH